MKITPKSSPGPRLYQSSRGLVPSVTEVLKVPGKPHVEFWRRKVGAKNADRKLHEESALGTKVHALAAAIARDDTEAVEKYGPSSQLFALAIRSFLKMHVGECIEIEKELVSDKHLFGGTLDLYCRLTDGSYAVVDYKTTAQLTREHGLQLAAYALLCREHGMKVNRRIAVRIKKDAPGKFYARTYSDHKGDVEAFLALKTYWHWAHRNKLERAA